mgnify:CR=1 FL=1
MNSLRLVVHNSIEFHSFNPFHVLYFKSNGNYCDVCLTDGGMVQNLPMSLGQMAMQIRNLLTDPSSPSFIQLGRQYIVNAEHILSVFPAKKCLVFDILNKDKSSRNSISPSSASLLALVEWLSTGVNGKSCSVLVEEPKDPAEMAEDEIQVLNHP